MFEILKNTLAKFHPHRCNVSPLRGEKPQNRPLSKLNTGSFALRAMLPVITGSIARSANLPVFSLLRGQFWGSYTLIVAPMG